MDGFKMCLYFSALMAVANADATDSISRLLVPGGSDVRISERPFQVLVRAHQGSTSYFKCGGSIVHPQWILTAAHCVGKEHSCPYSTRITILAGTTRLNPNRRDPGYEERTVSKIHLQPKRDGRRHLCDGGSGDLALLRLDRALHMTSKIKKIRIGYKQRLDTHTWITISGWGKTEFEDSPDHLKKAELKLTRYSRDGGIMELTSPNGKKSACHGDSGGPATIAHNGDLLVGVASGGNKAGCHPNDDKCYCGPGTGAADSSKYVNLANYGYWLKTTIR